MTFKTSISNQGYAIYKEKLTENELEIIKNDLTIKPFTCPGYGNVEDVTPYKLFKENDDKIYVPSFYGRNKYGNPETSKLKEPETTNIVFASNRPMRPYQQDIIKTYLESAYKIGGGIISVGCGRGKTVMGLKIAEELKVKTLILVHKEFLMNQWVDRIKEYLPEARVGYIQGKTLDIQRKDIVLAMIQSLSDPRKDKDYPANIFESFGLVIADECHHLAARQFCRSLAKYPFKYTLGLSATPDRADGLTRVFKHFLGDIVYKDSEIELSTEDIAMEHIPNSSVELYIYKMASGGSIDAKYNKEEVNYKQKPNIVTMKSNIANCLHRTRFLLSFLPRLIQEGRTILILSCRRAHITEMEKLINEMVIEKGIPECTVGLYVGGMKQEKLDISATKRVIIATYDMAEEAFDCKTLNTLIFGTPHKNIKQAVGRILREEKKKRKFIPLIIDVQDVFSTFNGWNKIREKYYKTEGYPMKVSEVLVKSKTEIPEVKFIKDIAASNKKSKSNSNSKNKLETKISVCKNEGRDKGDDGDEGCEGGGDEDDNDNDDIDDIKGDLTEKELVELDF
jgi:superfamily II DNA or RNA helicase